MNPQLTGSLITASLTAIAGSIGYIFHEYRQRSKPFISVGNIGDFWRKVLYVNISSRVINKINSSFRIRKLLQRDTLDEVHETNKTVSKVLDHKDGFISLVNQIISHAKKKNQDDLISSLSKCLSNGYFESTILRLISKDVIKIKDVNLKLPVVLNTYESSDNDGCIWIDFPGSSTTFGSSFNTSGIIKDKCFLFIEMIKRLDFNNISLFFKEVKLSYLRESKIATNLKPILDNIINEFSRWEFQVYIANLGRTPFIINTTAKLVIRWENHSNIIEDCYMVIRTKDKEGNTKRSDAVAPLVVRSEDDVNFSYFTENIQRDMKNGKLFREIYIKGTSKCRLEFYIKKPGILKSKKLKSPWITFEKPISH